MDLTPEHLDWLMSNFYYPVKFEGGRHAVSKECIYLESRGLVTTEQFPVVDVDSNRLIIVVSLTRHGHETISQIDPVGVLQHWGERLSDKFLEKYVMSNISLAELPELLVGANPRWRRLAVKIAGQLQEG